MKDPVYTPEHELVAGLVDTAAAVDAVELAMPNPYQRVVLYALPRTGKHVYAGTVPAATIAKRRAARKARRATRQAQRRAA